MNVNVEELRLALRERVKAEGRGAQVRIAKQMGIDRQYLNHMLNKRSPIPLDRLQQLMDALGVELDLKEKA